MNEYSAPAKFIDLASQQERIRPLLDSAISKVLNHGNYIMGPEVVEFESKLKDFTGCIWSISRQIIDYSQDANLTFTGRCEVLDGWYHETGQMVFSDGNFFSSTRRYRWKPCASGVDVHFDDGRFFHQIDLSTNSATATHFCDPDDYTVSYDFTKWPVWTAIWRVRGARKNYEMHSCYRKLAL